MRVRLKVSIKTKILILIALSILLLLSQGCASMAIGVYSSHYEKIEYPNILRRKGHLIVDEKSRNVLNASYLKEYWGEPDKVIKICPDKEQWIYKFGIRWNGIAIFMLIVPLPLTMPVGYNQISFTLQNEDVVFAEITDALRTSAYCTWWLISNCECKIEKQTLNIHITNESSNNTKLYKKTNASDAKSRAVD